jgi:hypothetical protein
MTTHPDIKIQIGAFGIRVGEVFWPCAPALNEVAQAFGGPDMKTIEEFIVRGKAAGRRIEFGTLGVAANVLDDERVLRMTVYFTPRNKGRLPRFPGTVVLDGFELKRGAMAKDLLKQPTFTFVHQMAFSDSIALHYDTKMEFLSELTIEFRK